MKNNDYGWVIILVIVIVLLLPAARYLYFTGGNSAPVYVSGPLRTNAYVDLSHPGVANATEPTSDLESEVLADGIVTAEEYQHAVDAYLTCMTNAGYEIKTTPARFLPGLFQYEMQPGVGFSTPVPDSVYDQLPEVITDCSTGTIAKIELMYSSQVANPENLDVLELTLTCLVTHGVIEDDASATTDYLQYALTTEDSDHQLDLEDEQTMSCLENPAQNGINGNPLVLPSPSADPLSHTIVEGTTL